MRNRLIYYTLCLLALQIGIKCTMQIAGTGSGGETKVIGIIVDSNNKPASNTQVKAIPNNYNPLIDGKLDESLIDTTDIGGKYEFMLLSKKVYNIQALHLSERTRLLKRGIFVEDDTTIIPAATLADPGAIRIILPDTIDTISGYVYIPGTTIGRLLQGAGRVVLLDSVPAGTIYEVFYGIKGSTAFKNWGANIPVYPGETVTLRPAWNYASRIVLNTTPAGADVAGTVTDFPVLVRLSAGNFEFSQARSDGADLRFSKPDGTLLPLEIEQWDSANATAAIWVRADTVYGNNATQSIIMLWGNRSVTPVSNSAGVFNSASGFEGVWHLGETGNTVARDATINGYDGTRYATAAITGVIGMAQEFDGSSSYIHMTGTASGKLNFPENGYYTISAWVNTDVIDTGWHMIAGKGHEQYYLKLEPDISIVWSFVEFHDKAGWQGCIEPATAKTWKHLVGIRAGNRQYLYVDGELADSTYKLVPNDTVSRDTTDDFSIGKYLRYVIFNNNKYAYFDGIIDEVRISSRVQSIDWIRLCYMNQRKNDKLLQFQ